MRVLEILRFEESDEGTFGILKISQVGGFCLTLEPPDKDNQKNISSIPPGTYMAERYHSRRYGWTYKIEDVEHRTYILFHPGNIHTDTRGCILLGCRLGYYKGFKAVLDSRSAFKAFLKELANDSVFELHIREVY